MRTMQALPVVLAVAALAGCGGGSSSTTDPSSATQSAPATQTQAEATTTTTAPTTATTKSSSPDGAKVFATAGCVGCHTLKAAGASGSVGPNLDNLQPSFEAVKLQVTNGGGGMPPFGGRLSSAEIEAVARYVSANAGR